MEKDKVFRGPSCHTFPTFWGSVLLCPSFQTFFNDVLLFHKKKSNIYLDLIAFLSALYLASYDKLYIKLVSLLLPYEF